MRFVVGGNFPYTRVGVSKWVKDTMPTPAYMVETGKEIPSADGMNMLRECKFPGYPIKVEKDTAFIDCHFTQEHPHTEIFAVAPGVEVHFGNPDMDQYPEYGRGDCVLINVRTPDGAKIHGGNLMHGAPDSKHPEIFLLCECDKCAPAQRELFEVLHQNRDGNYGAAIRDKWGRVAHHTAKEIFRDRRKDSTKVTADINTVKAENAAALAGVNNG